MAAINIIASASNIGKAGSTYNISVSQAYNIDKKVDDGNPQSGNVQAIGINGDPLWIDGTDTLTSPANQRHFRFRHYMHR